MMPQLMAMHFLPFACQGARKVVQDRVDKEADLMRLKRQTIRESQDRKQVRQLIKP